MVTHTPEIFLLRPENSEALTELFTAIAADPVSSFFHPHPFTEKDSVRICHYQGLDRYFGLSVDGKLLGYGMLRGWDEGFADPALGIYLLPELRRTGAGKLLMQHLHLASHLSGASRIRLKVYPDNASALRLYQAMGYRFDNSIDKDGQLLGIINLFKSVDPA